MPGSGAPADPCAAIDAAVADARDMFGRRHLEEAERTLRQALREHPEHAEGRHGLGVVLVAAGRYDEAATELFKAQRLDPLAPGPYRAMAQLYLLTGRPEEGVRFLGRCLDNPALRTTPALLMDLVDLHAATAETADIPPLLHAVERLSDLNVGAFADLGRCWYELDDAAQLRRLAARVEPPDTPKNAGVIALLGALAADLCGDAAAAAEGFRRAAAALPEIWLPPERLAHLLARRPELGRKGEAAEAARRAEALAPGQPDTRITAALVRCTEEGDEGARRDLRVAAQGPGVRMTLRRRAAAAVQPPSPPS